MIFVPNQFWAAYVGCSIQYKDAMAKAWEQIDVIHRMIKANPDTFEFVDSAQGTLSIKLINYINLESQI